MLGLIFKPMHQSSSQHPVTQGILYSPPQLNLISLLLFLFLRPCLNGNGLTRTIRSCLHIDQSVLSLILYLSSLCCTSRGHWILCSRSEVSLILKTQLTGFLLLVPPVFFSPCFFVLSPPLHTSTLSDNSYLSGYPSIHLPTPLPPEHSISLSHFTQQNAFSIQVSPLFFCLNLSSISLLTILS